MAADTVAGTERGLCCGWKYASREAIHLNMHMVLEAVWTLALTGWVGTPGPLDREKGPEMGKTGQASNGYNLAPY